MTAQPFALWRAERNAASIIRKPKREIVKHMQISSPSLLGLNEVRQPRTSVAAPFEPPEFTPAAKPPEAQAAQTTAPASYVRPGTHIDLKI